MKGILVVQVLKAKYVSPFYYTGLLVQTKNVN